MSFIRAKEIPPGSGNWYDYEVKTIHQGNKVIQKVIRYIGKSNRGISGAVNKPISHPVSIPDSPSVNVPRIPKMQTPSRQIASAMGMYYGGMPLDAIQQQFRQDYDLDMSESNYWSWVKRFTKEAIRQCKDFKDPVRSMDSNGDVTHIDSNGHDEKFLESIRKLINANK